MPYCPVCKCEYREGVKKCRDCDAELVPELPPSDEPIGDEPVVDEEFVPVYSSGNYAEVEIVKGVLLEAGIPVLEKAETDIWALPSVYAGPYFGGKILIVPASRLEEARQVIEEAQKSGEEAT